MKPYSNYTFRQLIDVISENNFLENTTINEVCAMAYGKMATERDGILLVRALRKDKEFILAHKYHEKLQSKYPNSEGLKNEALWLKFSSEVCNSNNTTYEEDAQYILDNTSQESPKSKLIFEVTTLITISRLIREEKFAQAYTWTTKLNPNKLSDEGREGQNGIYYPSNKQQYYRYKAMSLIGTDKVRYYVNWVFEYLKFTEEKTKGFCRIHCRIVYIYQV